MQNNVTDLSQRLQRSLDNSYNVIDMPTVIEIISALEKTAVTKELLETTRLGKFINELRRRTSNESLAKRAKELLKKWRDLILPDANGAIERPTKKRAAQTPPDAKGAKRPALNGQARELDFSDNSNCSVKDLKKTDVIFINSDSNSSLPDPEPLASSHDTQESAPKKRGRKKGSKNHKNLIIAAEESFTNKMSAVSRNSKVKTTQELLADLQNRTATPKGPTHQDIELRAAQLTESLSRIDQKLNPQKTINKNVTPIRNDKNLNTINNSSVKSAPNRTVTDQMQTWPSRTTTPEVVTIQSDDEIVDVVGDTSTTVPLLATDSTSAKSEPVKEEGPASKPITIEGLLRQLPPVDPACLEEEDEMPPCLCPLPPVVEQSDRITVQIVGESEKSLFAPPSPLTFEKEEHSDEDENSDDIVRTSDSFDEESANCEAKAYLRAKYLTDMVTDSRVEQLHTECLPNVNGNYGVREGLPCPLEPHLVPRLGAKPLENFQKYSISIASDLEQSESDTRCDRTEGRAESSAGPPESEFREWHETLDVTSYNGDLLRILPYVIID